MCIYYTIICNISTPTQSPHRNFAPLEMDYISGMKKKAAFPSTVEEFLEQGERYYLPHLSIDCVVFGFHDGHLKVLLLELSHTNEWCLPGGFIQHSEPVDDAAVRIVNQRTGLRNIYLRQFYAFGDPSRQL